MIARTSLNLSFMIWVTGDSKASGTCCESHYMAHKKKVECVYYITKQYALRGQLHSLPPLGSCLASSEPVPGSPSASFPGIQPNSPSHVLQLPVHQLLPECRQRRLCPSHPPQQTQHITHSTVSFRPSPIYHVTVIGLRATASHSLDKSIKVATLKVKCRFIQCDYIEKTDKETQ